MNELPAPLTPAHVDLRDREFMPLKGDRLFSSVTWIKADADGKVAALRLWWHGYAKEVPAASLPDDDTLLSEYAGYGVAVKAWLKVKPAAMRGWIKCNDGRWHHQVLAEIAAESWKWKQAAFSARAADRARKAKKSPPPEPEPLDNPAIIPPEPPPSGPGIPPECDENSSGIPPENPLGREGKGTDISPERRARDASADPIDIPPLLDRRQQSGIPRDWTPSDADRMAARLTNLAPEEIDAEAAVFRDHYLASGATRADWSACWRKWLGRRAGFQPRAPAAGSAPGVNVGGGRQRTSEIEVFARVGADIAARERERV